MWPLCCSHLHNAETVDCWKKQIRHLQLPLYHCTAEKLHYLHNCRPIIITLLHDNRSLKRGFGNKFPSAKVPSLQTLWIKCNPENGSVFNVSFLFLRRKKDDNITFDTVCHNPAQRLHGLILEDYNNSKCEMKERKGMGSQFFICSCNEEECNEQVFFNPSKFILLHLFVFVCFVHWQMNKLYLQHLKPHVKWLIYTSSRSRATLAFIWSCVFPDMMNVCPIFTLCFPLNYVTKLFKTLCLYCVVLGRSHMVGLSELVCCKQLPAGNKVDETRETEPQTEQLNKNN